MVNFEDVIPLSRESALDAFESDDPGRICRALVAISFHDEDWQWVQNVCLRYLESNNPEICSLAAVCLGHVARIHGKIDKGLVLASIRSKMGNEKIKGILEDACDDIDAFG